MSPASQDTAEAHMHSILVVDDDADTCRNMTDVFTILGYAVDAADGGDAALEKARRQPYDLGLLDLRMPGMDGLTLCRHLKRLHPCMVTMIITGYVANTLAEEAHDAGSGTFLPSRSISPDCVPSLNKPSHRPTDAGPRR